MLLKLTQNTAQKDIEVSITYPVLNKTVERIASFIKSVGTEIECHSEDGIQMVKVSDIFYIESVDKTAVVFCEKGSYRTKLRLYQLEEKLADKGFIQCSRYCILNINKLEKVKPLFNSRMEAVLSNGIRLFVTRKYIAGIKRALQEEHE
jgi:DNA-binding LytR/AlgR family response regulator